jgi:hypothetical protein
MSQFCGLKFFLVGLENKRIDSGIFVGNKKKSSFQFHLHAVFQNWESNIESNTLLNQVLDATKFQMYVLGRYTPI